MSNKHHIFYHKDLDGRCSAGVMYHFLVGTRKHSLSPSSIIFHSITYGMEFPFEKIAEDDHVYIVDYSIHPDEMLRLWGLTKNIVWIDHHITAIEKYKDFPYDIGGNRDTAKCGALLCWEWCFPDQDVPASVLLTNDYDLWTFQYGDFTKSFQIYMETFEANFPNSLWLDPDIFEETEVMGYLTETPPVRDGRLLLNYKRKTDERKAKSLCFTTKVDDIRFLCANTQGNSATVDSMFDPEKHDAIMLFHFNGRHWKFGLYTEKDIDLTPIAVANGGGGHKKACGFELSNEEFCKSFINKED